MYFFKNRDACLVLSSSPRRRLLRPCAECMITSKWAQEIVVHEGDGLVYNRLLMNDQCEDEFQLEMFFNINFKIRES